MEKITLPERFQHFILNNSRKNNAESILHILTNIRIIISEAFEKNVGLKLGSNTAKKC